MALSLEQIDSQLKARGVRIPQDDNFNSNIQKPKLSLEQIDSMLKKRGVSIPETQNETTENERGFKGVGKDVINLAKGIPHAIGQFLEASSELPALGKQALTLPYDILKSGMQGQTPRLTKNVLTGANQVANWPSAIASYLGKKDFISPEIGKAIHLQEHDFGLGKPQEGDVLSQMLPGMIVPFKMPNALKKLREPSKAEQIAKARAEHDAAIGYENTLNEELANKFQSTNPQAVKGKMYRTQQELENALLERKNIPEENLTNRLMPPKGEDIVPKAEQAINDWENKVRHTLQEGATHSENFAQRLVHHISGTKNENGKLVGGLRGELGSEYDKLKERVEPFEIEIEKKPDISDIEKSAMIILSKRKNGYTPEDKHKLIQRMIVDSKLKPEIEKIPAKDIYNKYRTLKKESESDLNKAYQIGQSPESHEAWKKRSTDKKNEYLRLEQLLEEKLPDKQLVADLKDLNKRYSTEYAPVHENPFYQKMLNEGKISDSHIDIFSKLSGTGKGQDILRKFVLSDPELIHSMFGHQFSSHPQRLLQPSTRKNQYFQNPHPRVSTILNLHNEGVNLHHALLQAQERASRITEEYSRAEKAAKEDIAKQQKREKLANGIAVKQKKIAEAAALLQKKEQAAAQTKMTKTQLDELVESIVKNPKKLNKIKKLAGTATKMATGYNLKSLKDLISELLD